MKGKDRTIELPGYLILSFEELIPLLVCVAFDLTEYFAMFLLAPLIGDFLDIVGVGICLYLCQCYMYCIQDMLIFKQILTCRNTIPRTLHQRHQQYCSSYR